MKNSDDQESCGVRSDRPGRRDWLLLLSLVPIWAISWPVIKAGVADVPPIWYGCLRYAIAAALFFPFVAFRGELAMPQRSDWPLVAISGALQMAAYSALSGLALTILPPGRASVLAYSTPILVVPLAAWRLGECVRPVAAAGVGVGLLGILVVASPSLHSGAKPMLAYAMLLGAAAAWAVAIVTVRRHRFASSALSLAPWQMLVAAVLLLPIAVLVEGAPPPIMTRGAGTLAYVAPVATAFAYWAIVETGRCFPASTISMALLATPGLGLTISAVALDEAADMPLLAGMLLTAIGIRLATRKNNELRWPGQKDRTGKEIG